MPTAATPALVHRFEVTPGPGQANPRGERVKREAESLGIRLDAVEASRIYLVEAPLDPRQARALCERLLADPVVEQWREGASPAPAGAASVEVHPLPGVMDPAAQSVHEAAADLLGLDPGEIKVSTGWRYDLHGPDARRAHEVALRLLANPVIHAIHTEPYRPERLPVGHAGEFRLGHVPIRELDELGLARLSREAHLFLSPEEMLAIRDEYRRLGREPTDIELETLAQTWSEHCVHKTLKSRIRYRSDAATKRRSDEGGDIIEWAGRPGHSINDDGSVTIDNLLKSTVAAATHELIADGVDWTLSVFKDNAGIVALDDETAVCIKVETHNHPSALEPYGGSATGIGGCIRDVIGTGLAARPIANTDVFCVAYPSHWNAESAERNAEDAERTRRMPSSGSDSANSAFPLPAGCLHPKRILTEVVAGVRDYGNRMGIPTLNGAVYFDDRYVGNPLVFCGCIGVMPRDKIEGEARPGDLIVALGGRTGRDGIHGATFSSAELTDTHADEFSHAVQIGNAIEEKRLLDAILRARDYVAGRDRGNEASRQPGVMPAPEGADLPRCPDASMPRCLYNAITDCGAGGFSSAVGEMGGKIGAIVQLENAPLKYEGLTYTEIWISEAQERMVLAVPRENLPALQKICDEEHVELAVLGTFGAPGADLVLTYRGTEVGRLPMRFLHEGIPQPTREAVWNRSVASADSHAENAERGKGVLAPTNMVGSAASAPSSAPPAFKLSPQEALLALLGHPNIASKHWIIRQYDHEVQGNTILRPLVGPAGRGPGDASVVEPVPGSGRGLAVGCGLATSLGDPAIGGDPYLMALAGIDECVRNLVCVGADPERIAILDNFCWPSCNKPENLGSLVRAAEGCYDGAKAYRTPFVSGKDSLNNQFTTESGRTIEIPPTLLITGMGIVPDIARCVTSDAKRPGNVLLLIGETTGAMGGSHHAQLFGVAQARLASNPESIIAEVERRAAGILASIPEAARRQAQSLLRSLAPTAVSRLDNLVGAFGPRASDTAKRLAARLGNPAVEKLAAEIGPERVQDLLRAVAAAAESQGLSPRIPSFDPALGARTARAVAACIREGLVASAHDCSDGGLGVGVAEMLIGGHSTRMPIGAQLVAPPGHVHPTAWMFAENPGRYVLEVPALQVDRARTILARDARAAPVYEIGVLDGSGRLRCPELDLDVAVDALTAAWRGTLDW